MDEREEMMVANITGGPSSSSPAQAPSPLQSPPTIAPSALQPSDGTSTSSTSPTNTSASDSSTVSPLDLAALLAAARPNLKTDFSALINRDSQPMSNPAFPAVPDPGALLNFLQQAHQQAAIMQAARATAAAQELRRQQEQRERQQHQTEKKRSYPCTFQFCVICQKDVHSSKLPCHIRQCHVAKPMFQCPQCDFTSTYSKNNVKSHMVSLHGLAGDPISYMDRYAPQVEEFMKMCFPNVRGRGRPMQGRGSPRSPKPLPTPARTNATTPTTAARRPSFSQEDLLALQQQQRQLLLTHSNMANLSPFTLFPQTLFANNNNSLSTLKPPLVAVKTEPPPEVMDVVVSTASTVEEVVEAPRPTFKTISQPVRPGENWQPKYSSLNMTWCLLDEEQARQTIFNNLKPLPNLILELPSDIKYRDVTTSLLSEQETLAVKSVRERIDLKYHEILFAIDKMNNELLKNSENIDLLVAIAPCPLDAAFFRQVQVANMSEEESFLISLTDIPRLENKLTVMKHMINFDDEVRKISTQLTAMCDAAKLLITNEPFRSLIQLVLTMYQQLLPALPAGAVPGFVVSKMMEICSSPLLNGEQILNCLAQAIRENVTEITGVFELIPYLEKAANGSYSEQEMLLSQLKDGNARAEMELKSGQGNEILAVFLERSRKEIENIVDLLNSVRATLHSLLAYMAEPLPYPSQPFEPELFFRKIYAFLVTLKDMVERIDV